MPQPADAIHNERTKLAATWLNTVAAGTVVAGVIAPSAAMLTGVLSAGLPAYLVFAGAWVLAGAALHWMGQRVLENLK